MKTHTSCKDPKCTQFGSLREVEGVGVRKGKLVLTQPPAYEHKFVLRLKANFTLLGGNLDQYKRAYKKSYVVISLY